MSVLDEATASASGAGAPEQTHALVIGIESYDAGPAWDLNGPANDAFGFARWLVGQGVPAENVRVLVAPLARPDKADFQTWNNAPVVRPTRQNIADALTRALPKVTGERLYVFWSGHGYYSEEGERRLFYADAHPNYLANLDFNALLLSLASDYYTGFPTQIFFVDACASTVTPTQDQLMPGDALPKRPHTSGREQFALFAASRGEVALNVSREQAGLFSSVLLEALGHQTDWPPDMGRLADEIDARFGELRAQNRTHQVPIRLWYRDRKTESASIGFSVAEATLPPTTDGLPMTGSELRDILVKSFSLSELNDLLFDLGVNYENISGDTLPARARETVLYFQRYSRFDELAAAVQKARPLAPGQAAGASGPPAPPGSSAPPSPTTAEPTAPATPAAPAATSAASQPRRLIAPQLLGLRTRLLAGQAFKSAATRDAILSMLDPQITIGYSPGPNQLVDVYNLLQACNLHDGGIQQLVEAVRAFETDPAAMQAVDDYLAGIA